MFKSKKIQLSKRNTIGVLFTVTVLALCGYVYLTSQSSEMSEQGENVKVAQKRSPDVAPTSVPEGWSIYRSDDFGVTFAYPSTWTVQEQRVTEQSNKATLSHKPIGVLLRTVFTGDGYVFILNRDGHGLEDDSGRQVYTHSQGFVDGLPANVFENQTATGFSQSISVEGGETYVVFSIMSEKSKLKEPINKILSTVNFYLAQ